MYKLHRICFILLVLFWAPAAAIAQTYILAPTPVFTGLDTNGDPVASGRLCTLAAGTTTPLASYSDSSGTANTNPIILSAAGRATIYLTSSSYRFILRDSTASSSTCASPGGVTIWDQDNIISPTALTISGTVNTVAKFNSAGSNVTNSSITDTGSAITLGNATTVTTSVTSPIVYGGSAATSRLRLRSTSGTGTTDSITLEGGTNGDVVMLTANTGSLSSNLGLTVNSLTTTNGTFGSLTSGRVTFAGASGILSDDSDLTFSGDRLTATNLTVSALTGGLVTSSIAGVLGVTTSVTAASGGTAINTSASSGVPSINSGTWAVNNVLTANRILYGAASNTIASSANLAYDGTSFTVGTVGPHAIGGATTANVQIRQTGAFTGSTATFGLFGDSSLTAIANGSAYGWENEITIIEAGSGTHPMLVGAGFNAAFTNNAGAITTNAIQVDVGSFAAPTGTTTATGIRVAAPTGATNNHAAQFISASNTVNVRMVSSAHIWDITEANSIFKITDVSNSKIIIQSNVAASGDVQFPSIGTTASGANAFLDTGDSNSLLRSTSSARYKTGIEPLSIAEARAVLGFTPVKFRSTGSVDDPHKIFWGLIAEQVDSVLPDIFTTFIDLDGKKVPDGLQYGHMIAPAIRILQDHDNNIQDLRRRVAALEAQ